MSAGTSRPVAAHGIARPGTGLATLTAMACVAQFMVVLDTSIVNVALASMRTALRLSEGQQQWVISAYLITLGGLLLLAARAGDLFGWRRVFTAGLTVFTAASLLGGLAPNATVLLLARGVQRQLRSELKMLSALPVAELRTQADQLARELRELDVRIQGANWEVDLLD